MVMWNQAQTRQMFDRLMSRPVFAKADRIVRVDMNRPGGNQSRHTYRVARVVGKHQKCRIVRDETAVQSQAGSRSRSCRTRAHRSRYSLRGICRIDVFRSFPDSQIRTSQIGPTRRSVQAAVVRRHRAPFAKPCAKQWSGLRFAFCEYRRLPESRNRQQIADMRRSNSAASSGCAFLYFANNAFQVDSLSVPFSCAFQPA